MRRNSNLIFFFVFFGIAFLMLVIGKIGVFSGSKNEGANVSWKIAGALNVSKNNNSEIDKLKQENSDLKKQILDDKELVRENKALKDQFSTTSISSTNLIPAKVVGSPGFIPGITNPDYLVIDKGLNDGLKVGDGVVYQNNFVGQILNISSNYSKIRIALNTNSFTGKISGEKDILGVIKGKGNVLIFDNVLLSEKLNKDQLVLTKGDLNEKGVGIPADLVVGKIISVEKKSSDLFQRAEVKSLLDFNNLSTVFVIKQ